MFYCCSLFWQLGGTVDLGREVIQEVRVLQEDRDEFLVKGM